MVDTPDNTPFKPDIAVGDSIACGICSVDGDITRIATEGLSPQAIYYKTLQAIHEHPDAFNKKKVLLSTGSNDTGQIQEYVTKTIQLLKDNGASDIMLLGIGDRKDLAPYNDTLSNIAKASGVRFTPMTQTGPDQVHPKDYRSLWERVTGSSGHTVNTSSFVVVGGESGDTPDALLNKIHNAITENKDAFRGKDIFLVSGADKDASHIDEIIPRQIQELLQRGGAAHVVLQGFDADNPNIKLNPKLLSIASANGAQFMPEMKGMAIGGQGNTGSDSGIIGGAIGVAKGVYHFFQNPVGTVKGAVASGANELMNHAAAAAEKGAKEVVTQKVDELEKKAEDKFGPIIDFFTGLWDKVKGFFSKIGSFFGFGQSKPDAASTPANPNPADPDNGQGGFLSGLVKATSNIPVLGTIVQIVAVVFSVISAIFTGHFSDLMKNAGSFYTSLTGGADDGSKAGQIGEQLHNREAAAAQDFGKSIGEIRDGAWLKGAGDLIHSVGEAVVGGSDSLRSVSLSALNRARVKVESGGRADAVSPKGARGLAQLMPPTARELEKKYGFHPGDSDRDPRINQYLGDMYQKELLEKYHGDAKLALAAYNAGQGTVDTALKEHGDNWLASLKPETRNYVPNVLAEAARIDAAEGNGASRNTDVASVKPMPTPSMPADPRIPALAGMPNG